MYLFRRGLRRGSLGVNLVIEDGLVMFLLSSKVYGVDVDVDGRGLA